MFPTFYFDGNRWFGVVDSDERWCELVAAYDGAVQRLLGATNAPRSEVAELPAGHHLDAPEVRQSETESFGFRCEHVGAVTLGAWARTRGYDLAAGLAAILKLRLPTLGGLCGM
mgnify:CR=1 FL=1